ncbi:putative RNA-directed DNA polymerase from transposon X-element [Trichonephila clavipes]|nr:putative RNA-directed DNA polymerase from transposon X-element [Trichonephila clavipes]
MVKTESVDTAVQEVTNVLIAAADLSIPKVSSHSFQRYKPWWNTDCQTAYKNQRKLWGIFRRYPTTENLLAFKKAKANARRVRRQRQSWIRYVSSLTSSTYSKQLWKKVKAANGIYREFSFPILQTSNSVFSSPVEIANILGETFQSVSSAASYNFRFLEIKRQAERTPINFSTRSFFLYNCDFMMPELKKALLHAHNTSPGPDGITYTMLRHLNPNSLANILFLFNRVWKEHCFPSSWREAIVIPILKSCKVATDPLSYRPIALTSCFCKTFERMVNTRLVKRNLHPDPSIHIGNIQIPVVSEVRFLGVIFDSKLTFLPHVLYLRKKCERSLNILKVLSNTLWGADRVSLLRVYQALILSRLDYDCVVYGSARASVLKRLDTLHHSALRICSGAFRTSLVTSLYVVCHQPPLDLRRRQLSANYFIRAMSVPSHPLKPFALAIGLNRLYEARSFNIKPFSERAKAVLNDAHLNNINIQENNILAFPPWDIQIFNYHNPFSGYHKAGTADVIYQQLFSFHRSKYSKYIPVYTDGSKTAGHVGCGVVFNNTILSFSLHNSMSVFSAELTAILIALQHILISNHRHFCVYTDSMNALESLHFLSERRPPTVIEILILLRKLERKGFHVIFSWVPGHVGILGNKQADTAARSMSDHMQRPVCYQDLKTSAQNYIHRVWQETWDQQVLNKLHSIHPSTSHWAALPVRRYDVRLTRLRIGHTRFTHRHLLLGENAPECPSCKVPYSVCHILIDCPVFNRRRITFFHTSVLTLSDLVEETPHQNLFALLLKIGFLHLI